MGGVRCSAVLCQQALVLGCLAVSERQRVFVLLLCIVLSVCLSCRVSVILPYQNKTFQEEDGLGVRIDNEDS